MSYMRLWTLSSCRGTILRWSERKWTSVASYHTENGVYGYMPRRKEKRFSVDQSIVQNRIQNSNLLRWVTAYREHGHRKALIDPLDLVQPREPEELDPSQYGVSVQEAQQFNLHGILHTEQDQASVTEIKHVLESMYCGPVSAEFHYVTSAEEREWFAERYEQMQGDTLSNEKKVAIAKLMLKGEAFDHFLANKFTTLKRYGGEGAESVMGFYDELFEIAAKNGISNVVLCIAHRGRNNLLTCLLNYPPVTMFRKIKGKSAFPPTVDGHDDVLSHLFSCTDLDYDGSRVHVSMLPNPSHLEAVNPVAQGKTRAKQQTLKAGDYAPIMTPDTRTGDQALCFQIHGDASFSAQGIVPETFTLADVAHFGVGGSIHLIINNQLGFTTPAEKGRSSQYTSDIGKINACPVIHVNADYPEEIVKVCRLAMDYREKFRKDIVIDLVCFRKYGHNEVDDPTFTQPIMYGVINKRKSIPELYAEKIVTEGVCTSEDLRQVVSDWTAELSKQLNQADDHVPKAYHLEGLWKGMVQAPHSVTSWDTGIDTELLKFVGAKSVTLPGDFKPHPTLQKTHIERRLQRLETGTALDWATAEALAFGSLLYQGFQLRISGQDVGRGTFSHRHVMLVDQESDSTYVPLNHIMPEQTGFLEVCNSILSEEAVLGFEYGMSLEDPKNLVIWEAQFGDFFNGAQIIVDTMVTGGETKWLLQSGLVMLLPHGMDGAGPEHSSCRIERFLQLCNSKEDSIDGDDVNIQIANPTTPAQYFHLLRRQMVRNYRKPLVMATPKVILRLPAATSTLAEMAPGTSFKPVLQDDFVNPSEVTRIVFCFGKHYYTLHKQREVEGIKNTAIIRIEQLCPFPAEEIRQEITKYTNATEFIWGQEEHRNQGAWSFVDPRFQNIVGNKLKYLGREVQATPATGVGEIHKKEADELLQKTIPKS